MKRTIAEKLAHFFHVVSEVKPIVWMGLYVCATPIFALIYWALPDNQFRLPDGAGSDYGSWLYYSIVTITTLGFGDYTPAHAASQAVTAVEVMCGLIFLGFFLNSVGAMKSEIDVGSEIEKQRMVHQAMENDKLRKSVPMLIDSLNFFLAYCYAVTTPKDKRNEKDIKYDPDFTFQDLRDLFLPSGLPFDHTNLPAIVRLLHSAEHTSIALDSLQQRVDLTLWPTLLEDCFAFVANYQMFSNTDVMFRNPDRIILADGTTNETGIASRLSKKIAEKGNDPDYSVDPDLKDVAELYNFIKENANKAIEIETYLAELALKPDK